MALVHGGRLPLVTAPTAEAQAAGRSTPCTQSGGRAGDPCAGPAGPGLHLAGGALWAAPRLHVLGSPRSWAWQKEVQDTWPAMPDTSCLRGGLRASCFTHRPEMQPNSWVLDPLPVGWPIQWTGLRFTEGWLLLGDRAFFQIIDGRFSLA